ncbi:MAG: CoA activase [Deltaproteobacteria bacterium]|nr:CoA activase [Deltaproteobacteria bacterium]
MGPFYLGIDVGAESVKVAALRLHDGALDVVHEARRSHPKDPHAALRAMLSELDSELDLRNARGIAATGRLAGVLHAQAVPTKAAMRRGVRLLHAEHPAMTVLSIGAHGFSVLEVGAQGEEWFQQNSRCSQGTGNFLSQLVQRFGLTVEEAATLADGVDDPAHLSGRCPVILKTDMTHLANKGEDRARIVAGLYDAVCDNVLTLVRSRLAPRDVVLIGGVARSARVRRTIAKWLHARGMHLVTAHEHDEYLEAIGAATHAFDHPSDVCSIDDLFARAHDSELERVPPLRDGLTGVRRIPKPAPAPLADDSRVLIGLDIGSTGSKAVAIDATSGVAVWETYLNTEGAPVHATQRLVERWVTTSRGTHAAVLGFGVTGSGREVAGSLLRTCYGNEGVFILNEIAAHARGATSIDPDVDTIFEIGGQDAKYIRLEEGRVVDAAMNEACSAGTGSFIAEQGTKFDGVGDDVAKLGNIALDACEGVSLGQHCSVFMAEVIDEAIAQGVARDTIIAGLYDSIIQNYLNRVKGPRSVGKRVFCQGMPFSADALAAAVARQTGRDVVVPPSPGTIGALGIALLARDRLRNVSEPLDPQRFLGARVMKKETIVCHSKKGCGEPGNKCRIDRLTTDVAGKSQKFLWGGNCSLYDKGAGRKKLPDQSPDVFREREELVDAVIARAQGPEGAKVVALTDEFALKGMLPLFVTFLGRLGFRCDVKRHAGAAALRKGIEGARVPYCAPMQMYHGVFFEIADKKPDFALLPMVIELPRVGGEEHAVLCPIVQASPDLVGSLVEAHGGVGKVLRPTIKFDESGYDGGRFVVSMRELARELGAEDRFEAALADAVAAQRAFDAACLEAGKRALAFCDREGVVPVAILGRPYTIYNDVLNSNVPSILRSLGALPIPVDCLPVSDDLPIYDAQYWGYTQRNLRAADQVRRTPGLYSVFCSNYACGPDSFTLRFYSYMMQGKPSAVIETDGHSGDAGTRTRMEAFLFCVDADLESGASLQAPRTDFARLDRQSVTMGEVKRSQALMLLPRMGPSADMASAALRGEGFQAETLRLSTREDVRTGRRYTSGKECVPMMLTLGTLLERLEKGKTTDPPDQKYVFFMPTAKGPCRFGVYHSLHKIVLEETGWSDRVKIVSPDDSDYFKDMSADFSLRVWLGFVARDMLQSMLLDVRPVERERGEANAIYDRWNRELMRAMENPPPCTAVNVTRELFGGLWGTRAVLRGAADEFARAKDPKKNVPTVAVVGEIYVRLDPFANDFIVEKLEARGLRVRLAPFVEWLEYTAFLAEKRVIDGAMRRDDNPISIGLSGLVQRTTLQILYDVCAKPLGWGPRPAMADTLEAAKPYVHGELVGEAVLTVGGPVHELHEGLIHGAVIVGPHECMPCKIAEAQYGKAAEDMKLPYLSLGFNGDPLDTEAVDRFAYDVHEACSHGRATRMPALDKHVRQPHERRRVHLPTINVRGDAASAE